jgi:hypothetical protein
VSHETIYRSLFVQARGVLKKALIEHLRTHRPIGRSRHATAKADLRGRIPDTVSTSERPASIEDRSVPGALGRGSAVRVAEIGQCHRLQPRRAHAAGTQGCARKRPESGDRKVLHRRSGGGNDRFRAVISAGDWLELADSGNLFCT